MATYNRAHFIGNALDSLSAQTFKDWECHVIDDGSTDDTGEILKMISKKDCRVKYNIRGNKYKKGLPGSRNYGLDLAVGEFILFMDDDDVIHPEALETCLSILEVIGEANFCRFDKQPFFEDQVPKDFPKVSKALPKKITKADTGRLITGELPFASCTVLWKASCFTDLRFNEELMYAEEWELYSKILSSGYEGVSIDRVLYYNRKHPNSNTGEFYNNDSERRSSKVKAVKLVIQNLADKNLLTKDLNLYFIRLGFFLKEPSVIDFILKQSNSSFLMQVKYKAGYKFYALLRPIFLLKKELKKKMN